MKAKKKCTLCKCTANGEKFGFPVCHYHYRHGEDDPPCPICETIGNPRWTYTANGELPPKKVSVRQVTIPKTVFLDDRTETVLCIEHVVEPAPLEWPREKRLSVIMIGLGQQVGENFVITQWSSDWERELMDAARPSLGLARKVYTADRGNFDVQILAGRWVSRVELWDERPLWPAIDVRSKNENVFKLLKEQAIEPQIERDVVLKKKAVWKYWYQGGWESTSTANRAPVWRHNYLEVLDTSMRIFQIERSTGGA